METTAIQPVQTVQFAGFWRRLAAIIIDGLIVWGFIGITALFSYYVLNFKLIGSGDVKVTLLYGIGTSILMFLFFSYLTAGKWQATIGKRLLGVYIVKKTPQGFEKPSFALCLKRYSAYSIFRYIIFGIYLYFYLDFYTALIEKKGDILNNLPALAWMEAASLIPMLVWYLPAAWTKEKTALHDLLFDTRALIGKI